jgi:hypothetical protein
MLFLAATAIKSFKCLASLLHELRWASVGAAPAIRSYLSVPAGSLTTPAPSDEPLDIPRLIATAARYGVEILPPQADLPD